MGNVEHYLVFREIEHPAKGYGRFGDSEIWLYVSAMCAHSVQYACANFFGQRFQLFVVELLRVVRLADFLYIHIYILYVWFYVAKLLSYAVTNVIRITEKGNTNTFVVFAVQIFIRNFAAPQCALKSGCGLLWATLWRHGKTQDDKAEAARSVKRTRW